MGLLAAGSLYMWVGAKSGVSSPAAQSAGEGLVVHLGLPLSTVGVGNGGLRVKVGVGGSEDGVQAVIGLSAFILNWLGITIAWGAVAMCRALWIEIRVAQKLETHMLRTVLYGWTVDCSDWRVSECAALCIRDEGLMQTETDRDSIQN